MQKKKQRVEIIFINLGEETSVTVRKNDGVSGNAVEKENDVRSYEDTEEKEHSPSFAKEVSKYEVAEQVDYFLNEYKVAKNHKDLLLRAIFKEKEDFLSLYNVPQWDELHRCRKAGDHNLGKCSIYVGAK